MKNKLLCLAFLIISSNVFSQGLMSINEFMESIKNRKFTRVECERKSSYSKNHIHTPTSKGKYAKPNFYDLVYIDLIENTNQREFNIWWNNSSQSKFNKEFIADSKIDDSFTSYKENIKVTKETSSFINFQSPEDITGRIDMFELDKLNGNLKMHIWEMKTTQMKSNDTFKFKQESSKKELTLTETIQFKCK
jgi:hypothetical protein